MKIEKIENGLIVTGITEEKLWEAFQDEEETSRRIADVGFTKYDEKTLRLNYHAMSLTFSGLDITEIQDLLHEWFPELCK